MPKVRVSLCRDAEKDDQQLLAEAGQSEVPAAQELHNTTVGAPPEARDAARVLALPPGVAVACMVHAADCPGELPAPGQAPPGVAVVHRISLVHPFWASLSHQEEIWRMLAFQRWPGITPTLALADWRRFFIRRYRVLREHPMGFPYPTGEVPPIENCGLARLAPVEDPDWEFKCPVALSLLQRTKSDTVDYCAVCRSPVYLVESLEELQVATEEGKCVALAPGLVSIRRRRVRRPKGKRRR